MISFLPVPCLCAETRLHHFELLLVRLLHLLAHHPDFSTDIEDLANFARYAVHQRFVAQCRQAD